MNISVVIPTFNEEACIAKCLDALNNGTEKPFEIIVADGMSIDRTREIAKEHGAVVVDNFKKHAAGGRNAGIKKAKGEVIAFIDADCVPYPDWLEQIHKAFDEEPDLDGLGTYIEPAKPANIYEEFWGTLSLQIMMSYGEEPYYVKNKTLNTAFITASCAYKRNLLKKIHGFSNFFANNAEDIDICWRALDAGAKLKYVPTAKIIAHSPTTIEGIKKKSFRNGVSSSKLQKVYFHHIINIDKNLYRALFKNIRGIFKKDRFAKLFVIEICYHLLGKYYGSIKCGVINI